MSSSNTAPTTCETQNTQRQLGALWTIPQPRFTPVNPYTYVTDAQGNSNLVYTKFQLDMRRKAEILKYANNNTQTNSTTKKQNWSRLNTQSSVGVYSQNALQNTTTNPLPICPALETRPTSTTACGVPGTPMILQYDPTVPLYNYKNAKTYSVLPSTTVFTFEAYSKNEILYLDGYTSSYMSDYKFDPFGIISLSMTSPVGVLKILNSEVASLYSYAVNIPVGIWIYGFLSPLSKSHPDFSTQQVRVNIKDFTINVLYNTEIVKSVFFDNAANQYLGSLVYNLENINNNPTTNFYAIQHIGNINTLLTLPNCSNYNYTIQVAYNFYYDQLPQVIFDSSSLQTGIFSNLSKENTNVQINSIVSAEPSTAYTPSSFTQFTTMSGFAAI